MRVFDFVKNWWTTIPGSVKRFLGYSLLLFIIWKLLYHLWLQPVQWPDRPLVNAIAHQTTIGLNLFYEGEPYTYKVLEHQHSLGDNSGQTYRGTSAWVNYKGQPVLMIVPNCNALELMVLFAGFIICFPGPWKRKCWIVPAGILLIHLVNVGRSMALIALANSEYNRFLYFAHHYLFTITIYLFIFMLWSWHIKYLPKTQPYETA